MGIYITDPAINTQLDNLTGTQPVYIGTAFSRVGVTSAALQALPVWAIQFLTYDSGGNIIGIANGMTAAGSPNQLTWNNRASYTYS